MLHVREILEPVRHIIVDRVKWTDARLIDALNGGLAEVTKRIDYFVAEKLTPIHQGLNRFDISNEAIRLLRVEYRGRRLPQIGHYEMDQRYGYNDSQNSRSNFGYGYDSGFAAGQSGYSWRDIIGSWPETVIIDKQNSGKFFIFPIISEIDNTPANPSIEFNSNFGTVVNIETERSFRGVEISNDSGVLAAQNDNMFRIFYTLRLPQYTSGDDLLPGAFNYDLIHCMKHYIAAVAFRDNQVLENQQRAEIQMREFERKLKEFISDKSQNFANTRYRTRYNPMGA